MFSILYPSWQTFFKIFQSVKWIFVLVMRTRREKWTQNSFLFDLITLKYNKKSMKSIQSSSSLTVKLILLEIVEVTYAQSALSFIPTDQHVSFTKDLTGEMEKFICRSWLNCFDSRLRRTRLKRFLFVAHFQIKSRSLNFVDLPIGIFIKSLIEISTRSQFSSSFNLKSFSHLRKSQGKPFHS